MANSETSWAAAKAAASAPPQRYARRPEQLVEPLGGGQRAPGTPALPDTAVRFIAHFALGRYRWAMLGMFATETANATSGVLMPYAVNRIITAVMRNPQANAQLLLALRPALVAFVTLCAAEFIFGRVTSSIQFRVGPRLRQLVARALYHYLQYHSHRYFSENFAGALAHRISEASQGVTQTLWTLVTEFWPIAIVIGVSNVLLLSTNLWLGLFTVIWTALFLGLSFVLARRCQPYALAAASGRSDTTGHIVDSVTNISAARLFARLGFERDQLEHAQGRELVAVLRSNRYMERVRWFQFGSAAILKVGMVALALALWTRGQVTVGQFVMAVSLSVLIIAEVRNLSRRFLEFFEFVGNVGNGVRTIVRAHELLDAPDARAVTISAGDIQFDRVSFRYREGTEVFEHLSLHIPAGQRVGLVGSSGSGKTTFVGLLLRLYEPHGGHITIDGHDIASLTQDALHAQIGLIPQDPSLFHRTLRENIRYGRLEASDAEVELAVRRANADAFIAAIPEGYDSIVGERGVKLSGGQRQRIAIARVILKDAPVLILDEATSSLDSITEGEIQRALDEVMANKTVIVIAHRLSTVAHLDRILVFDHGKIVEDGSHAELLAKRGAYHRLWSRQSEGFAPEADTTSAAAESVTSNPSAIGAALADGDEAGGEPSEPNELDLQRRTVFASCP